MFKKISTLTVSLLAILAVAPTTYAAAENDIKDLRPQVNKSEWQLVKNDTTRQIKTYTREGDGKRINFKVDAMMALLHK